MDGCMDGCLTNCFHVAIVGTDGSYVIIDSHTSPKK